RSGHYVATGEVNGESVRFLVDTGATDVAMSEATGRRLGLRPGAPVTLSTANGLVRGARTTIDSIAIGPIRLEDVGRCSAPASTSRSCCSACRSCATWNWCSATGN